MHAVGVGGDVDETLFAELGQPRLLRLDHFFVDFEFKSRLLQRVIELLFHEAVRRMVGAFEHRAEQLYGKPTPDPASKPAV